MNETCRYGISRGARAAKPIGERKIEVGEDLEGEAIYSYGSMSWDADEEHQFPIDIADAKSQ